MPRLPSRQPVNLSPPERMAPQRPHLPPDLDTEDVIEGEVYEYEPTPRDQSAPDYVTEEEQSNWEADDAQPRMRVFAAQERYAAPLRDSVLLTSEPIRLSIKERHQLLIHTISLYEDEWKLAGIRANPKNDHVQAFLIPRNRKYNLKEAISRNQALLITIDARGNTEVKEPKKRGLLRRFISWLWGDD